MAGTDPYRDFSMVVAFYLLRPSLLLLSFPQCAYPAPSFENIRWKGSSRLRHILFFSYSFAHCILSFHKNRVYRGANVSSLVLDHTNHKSRSFWKNRMIPSQHSLNYQGMATSCAPSTPNCIFHIYHLLYPSQMTCKYLQRS